MKRHLGIKAVNVAWKLSDVSRGHFNQSTRNDLTAQFKHHLILAFKHQLNAF